LFKRVDLANVNCKRLRIVTHLKLSSALAERIVEGSHGHRKNNVPDYALYGCIYTINRTPHVVIAEAKRIKEQYHVEFDYRAEKWSRPPKDVNSPQILAAMLAEEPQEVSLNCDAYFVYDEKSGWKSRIEVPIPLPEEDGGEGPFTHVESLRLSKRKQEEIQYSIHIERTREVGILHRVYLAEARRGELSEDVPRYLLERSAALSRAFVTKEPEG